MKIRTIPINRAVPGMIVAADLYNTWNQLIISNGVSLTDRIIARLKYYSIKQIPIYIRETKKSVEEPVLKNASQYQAIKASAEFKQFQGKYVDTVDNFRSELNKLSSSNSTVDINGLLSYSNNLLENCRNGMHLFDVLHCMREFDDITYVHCVNVSLLCNVFGKWLKLPKEELDMLTLAGLLHDIGKLTLPSELINKQERLTDSEFTLIKTHTLQGYNMLKDKNLDERVVNAALMHHERCDGSGYPYRLKGNDIDTFAKIIAIVDVYDAMTSPRVYRPALTPFEAIASFEAEGLQKFDPKYIMIFLEEIVQAYIGNRVLLNNNMEGEIRMINKHALSRPVIQVGSEFIDLSKHNEIEILSMI